MMSSETHPVAARRCLSRILDRLSDGIIASAVDRPIDLATEAFSTSLTLPLDRDGFDRLISELVEHVRRSGCRLRYAPSPASCWSEATHLLDSLSGGGQATGYESVLLDVVYDDCACMEDILVLLADAIKSFERAQYRAWVYATEVDCLSWKEKSQLADIIMGINRGELRESLHGISPESLADDLKTLLDVWLGIERKARSFAPSSLFAAETPGPALPLMMRDKKVGQEARV